MNRYPSSPALQTENRAGNTHQWSVDRIASSGGVVLQTVGVSCARRRAPVGGVVSPSEKLIIEAKNKLHR